jgi:phage tail P2-like protein
MSESLEPVRHTLLPANRSPLEAALDIGFARLLERIDPPFPELMDPQQTPADFLPYLAADRGAPEWSSADSEQKKRATVAAAWPTHRLAGTKKALTLALEALDIVPKVTAWHEQEPPGAPYSLILDGELTEEHDARRDGRLEARLQSAKAERDTLTLRLYRNIHGDALVAAAVVSADTADLIYPKRFVKDLVPRERQISRLHAFVNKTLPEVFNG